jgi:DNA-binding GntR family transcriptional regulator
MNELAQVPAVRPQNLMDSAYLAVRDAITSGALSPGMRLREAALARHFAVSTTPIREALRRLERDGLVRHAPNRGALVADFSLREVLDLLEVRELLECRGARRAAQRSSRDLTAAAATIVAATDLVDHFERLEWNRLEVNFHRAVSDLGGNAQLSEMADRAHRNIQALCVRRLSEPLYGPDKRKLIIAHHRAILEAVSNGDADQAEAHAREHIHFIRDSVVEVLSSEGESTP